MQTHQIIPPGLARRVARPVPTRGLVLLATLLSLILPSPAGASSSAGGTFATGAYFGDASLSRAIAGVGFQPDFVIVNGSALLPAVGRTSAMVGNVTKPLVGGTALQPNMITSLDADGFTIGNSLSVNTAATYYYWVAFKAAPGEMVVGSYLGDGSDDRDITGVGFKPEYVIVMSAQNRNAVQRFAGQSGDASLRFGADDEKSDRIQDLRSDGFQIGHNDAVNKSGETYYYVAWNKKKTAGDGRYTGNGSSNQSITGTGFRPEYVIVRTRKNGSDTVHHMRSLVGNFTLPMGGGFAFSGGIKSFGPDGFTVGSRDEVNKSGDDFFYMAFRTQAVADLALGLATNRLRPNPGDTVAVTVNLSNLGPATADSIRVTSLLPAGLSLLSAVPSHGGYVGGSGLWSLDSLSTGASASLVLNARVTATQAGATLACAAAVAGLVENDNEADNDRASLLLTLQSADLRVTKSVSSVVPTVGDTLTYTVTLGNNGPDAADAIRLLDQLPAGLVFVSATPTAGGYVSTTGLWNVGSLPSGGLATLSLRGKIDAGYGGATITNSVAIVHADQADPDTLNNRSASAVGAQSADLDVTQGASSLTPNVGETVTITVRVHNGGPSPSTLIQAVDALPSGLTFLSATPSQGSYTSSTGAWNVGTLAADSLAVLVLSARVGPGTAGSTLINTATVVSAAVADPVGANNQQSVHLQVQAADLAITHAAAPTAANAGDTVVLTLSLKNNGPDAATNVLAHESLPVGLTYLSSSPGQGSYAPGSGTWTVGALASGATATLPISVRVNNGTGGQLLTSTAAVSGADQADPAPGNNSASAAVTVPSADLGVLISVAPARPNEGDTLAWHVTLTNAGPSAGSAILVKVTLPTLVTPLGATPAQGLYDTPSGTWTVGGLASGAVVSLDILTRVNPGAAGTTLTGSALVSAAAEADLVPGNNLSLAGVHVPLVDLSLAKSVGSGTANEGDTLTYTLTLANAGPDTATAITVTDLLPAGLPFVSATATAGGYVAGSGAWSVAGLPPGSSATLTLKARAGAGTGGTTLTNSAAVTAVHEHELTTINNSGSAGVAIKTADLGLAMTVAPPAPDVGAPVTFQLTLTNHGPDAASGIVVRDALPAGLAFTGAVAGQGSYVSSSGLWTVGGLAAGASTTLALSATTGPGTGGLTLTNSAVVQAAREADHVAGNNSAGRAVVVRAAIVASAATKPGGTRLPGSVPEEVFRLTLANVSATAETLQAVTFTNINTGPGSLAQRDAEWSTPELLLVPNPGTAGAPRAGSFSGGAITFTGLAAVIPASASLDLVLRAGVALTAHDGDALTVRVSGGGALTFSRALTVAATWPLDSGGALVVDGMAAAQVHMTAVSAASVLRGATGALAFNVLVPSNGYAPDTLNALLLRNLGTAQAGADVGALRVWRDGGNGSYDAGAGDDQLLGLAAGTGADWRLTGLSQTVPVAGVRLFAAADIAAGATGGRTLRLSLPASPDDGLRMRSANDGPRDAAVENAGALTIVSDPNAVIDVSAIDVAGGTLPPGGAAREVFRLRLLNRTAFPETLEALTLANRTTGPGTVAERDAEWTPLTLSNGAGSAAAGLAPEGAAAGALATASMIGGAARFEDVRLALAPGQSTDLVVEGGAARVSRDGDVLGLRLAAAGDLHFAGTPPLRGTWPMEPAGQLTVNGMTAAQVGVNPVPAGLIRIGGPSQAALDVVIPANGYRSDVLNGLILENLGTAEAVTDLARLECWEAGPDGLFDAGYGDDRSLGVFTAVGSSWTLDALSEPVPVGGRHLYVSVTVAGTARLGRTVRLALPGPPQTAVIMASTNDGLVDGGVANPEALTIAASPGQTILVSADPQASRTLLPGGAPQTVLKLRLLNYSARPETLEALTLRNSSTGPGTLSQLDAEWALLAVTAQSSPAGPAPLGPAAEFSGGTITLSDLHIVLPPGREVLLPVEAGASLAARDGDRLDLEIAGPAAFRFTRPVSVTGAWPVAPEGTFTVDGMSADQVRLFPIPSGSDLTGERRKPVLDLLLPANGYTSDQLQRLNVQNLGTARAGTDIARVELWADNGDGAFDAEAERYLGEFRDTGTRWEITGLAERIALGGLRVFVTADLADRATEGRTLRFSLPAPPDLAIGTGSGNDGPLDRSVENPSSRSISNADRISLRAENRSTGVVAPGQRAVTLLDLGATNTYRTPQQLRALSLSNASTGPGTAAQLDREIEVLRLYADQNGNGQLDAAPTDRLLGSTAFVDGRATFAGLGLTLTPAQSVRLLVVGEISRGAAADGDQPAVLLSDPFDLDFGAGVTVTADWPVRGGAWRVDGLSRDQLTANPIDAAMVGPEGTALALDFEIPADGYRPDRLTGLRLVNRGTAQPADIGAVRLWRDGGDGFFTGGAGDDVDLGALVPIAENWQSPDLGQPIPPGGGRFFAVVTAAAAPRDSVTVQLGIPVNGLAMASDNDGPNDLEFTGAQAVVISSAPLLGTLRVSPRGSTLGQSVTVQMIVENRSGESLTGVLPSLLQSQGEGDVTLLTGPTPAVLDLAPGASGQFEWQYRAAGAGELQLTGNAEGRGAASGVPRRSIRVTSNTHRVFVQANALELFAVQSPPFSVTPGQAGIVPLSLTFRNPGGESGSDVRLTGLRLRVEDAFGNGIPPAQLIARVTVNEGNRVYLVKAAPSIETTGSDIALTLASTVLVTRTEPVSLNLQLALAPDATIGEFRVAMQDSSWIRAEDATSAAPVSVRLRDATFPLKSGLARLVAEASRLTVAGPPPVELHVGPGQADVSLLDLRLENPGVTGITSDLRVSSLGVVLTDEAGQPIAEPQRYLASLQVHTALTDLATQPVPPGGGGGWLLNLAPPFSLPANTPLDVTIKARFAAAAPPGVVQLRLADDATLDARDALTRRRVPVLRDAGAGIGGRARIETPARQLDASGDPLLPALVTVGQRDVPALRGTLTHPGTPGTARIRVDNLTVQCRGPQLETLAPGSLLGRLKVLWNGVEVASVGSLPETAAPISVPLPGLLLDPGAALPLELRLDVGTTAPLARFQLMINGADVHAVDANSGQPVAVVAAAGGDPLFFSGLSELQPPAREAIVGLDSRMPAALVADGRETSAGLLTIRNTAPTGSGQIRIDHLRLMAADESRTPTPAGRAGSISVYRGEEKLGASRPLTPDSTSAWVPLAEPLVVAPGESVTLDLRLAFDTPSAARGFRLGLDQAGIGVIQPAGALLAVEVRAASGASFPLWTEAGNFSPTELRQSYANFPNPFAAGREETAFVYYLPGPAHVTLEIWTPHGDRVLSLLDGEYRPAGLHQADQWDGRNGRGVTVVNGVYLAALRVVFDDGHSESLLRKVAVVR